MKRELQNGFPSKGYILSLIKRFGLNHRMFTFCSDYGCAKAGILWYKNTLKKDMDTFIDFLKWNGIQIKTIRYGTKIYSIWFQKTGDNEI